MKEFSADLVPKVIIITGTPGTGKTTIAKLLNKRLDGIYVNIGDITQNGYFLGLDIKRGSLIADVDKLRHLIDDLLLKIKKLVVIDSILPDIVSPKNVLLIVVLNTAIEELNRRLNKKGFSASKIMENIDAELCKICTQDAIEVYGLERIIEVDTTSSTPKDTVSLIYEEIRKRVDRIF